MNYILSFLWSFTVKTLEWFKFDIKMALVSEGAWLYIMLTKRVALNTSSIHNMWLIFHGQQK